MVEIGGVAHRFLSKAENSESTTPAYSGPTSRSSDVNCWRSTFTLRPNRRWMSPMLCLKKPPAAAELGLADEDELYGAGAPESEVRLGEPVDEPVSPRSGWLSVDDRLVDETLLEAP